MIIINFEIGVETHAYMIIEMINQNDEYHDEKKRNMKIYVRVFHRIRNKIFRLDDIFNYLEYEWN